MLTHKLQVNILQNIGEKETTKYDTNSDLDDSGWLPIPFLAPVTPVVPVWSVASVLACSAELVSLELTNGTYSQSLSRIQ